MSTLSIIESEDRPSGETVSLVLLGFRNDLARHRALALLRQHDAVIAAHATFPCTVIERMDRVRAERLIAALTEQGAMARATPLDQRAVEPAAPPDDRTEVVAGRSRPSRWSFPSRNTRLALIIAAGAFLIFRQLTVDQREEIRDPLGLLQRPPRAAAPRAAHPGSVARRAAHADAATTAQIRRLITEGDLDAAREEIGRGADGGDTAVGQALLGEVESQAGNVAAAVVAYERSVELGSEDPNVFLALSAVYRQRGRQREAVDMLHRAQQNGAAGPDFEGLKQLVIAEQGAESAFGSTSSAHFTASFDEGEDHATAQMILSHLEDAYMRVGHLLGEYPAHRTPVAIYAARDFQDITHSPQWAGALYDGRIKVPVRGLQGDPEQLSKILRHEYTHSVVVSLSAGRCPVWLNEGIAMWTEDETPGERSEWARQILLLGRPARLRGLEKTFMRMSPAQATVAYAQSYLAVQHIVARHGERSLQNLIAAFATATSTDDAFLEALEIDLQSFESDLRDSLGIAS